MAARYTNSIVTYCESLQTLPHRGIQRDDIRPGLRITSYRKRVVIASPRRMVNHVAILGVFYGGQDYDDRLSRRRTTRRANLPHGHGVIASVTAFATFSKLPYPPISSSIGSGKAVRCGLTTVTLRSELCAAVPTVGEYTCQLSSTMGTLTDGLSGPRKSALTGCGTFASGYLMYPGSSRLAPFTG